jgi:hypothetical protein
MNIKQALEFSKQTGRSLHRTVRDGWPGWIKYDEKWTYKLSAVDLMADDWEPVGGYEHHDSGSKGISETSQG